MLPCIPVWWGIGNISHQDLVGLYNGKLTLRAIGGNDKTLPESAFITMFRKALGKSPTQYFASLNCDVLGKNNLEESEGIVTYSINDDNFYRRPFFALSGPCTHACPLCARSRHDNNHSAFLKGYLSSSDLKGTNGQKYQVGNIRA